MPESEKIMLKKHELQLFNEYRTNLGVSTNALIVMLLRAGMAHLDDYIAEQKAEKDG